MLGLTVSAAFVYLVLAGLDWQLFRATLSRALPGYLLMALTFLALDYYLRLYRWHRMLRAIGSPASMSNCARPFFVGFALNNLLPLRAGDLARAVAFRQTLAVPVSSTVATLVVERLLDLLVLLALLGISLAWLPIESSTVADAAILTPVAFAALLLTLAVILFLAVVTIWVRRGAMPSDESSTWRPVLQLRTGLRNLGRVLRALSGLSSASYLLALSLAIWLLEAGVFAAVMWSLDINAAGTWLTMSAGTLGTLLPGSPGHIGTFDFFAITGMVAYGAERTVAVACVFLVHILLWLPLTTLGVLLMLRAASDNRDSVDGGRPDVN